MEFDKIAENVKSKLSEKGINEETQNYVIKYLYVNQHLFGDFLDIDQVAERISNNLKHDIQFFPDFSTIKNASMTIFNMLFTVGLYNARGIVIVNPFISLLSAIPSIHSKMDSIILHELDHCATHTRTAINGEEKKELINSYINNSKGAPIKKFKKIFFNSDRIKSMIPKFIHISGISDITYYLKSGISLININEGITTLKQELYDNSLGRKTPSVYGPQKETAKFISETIGMENLIKLHFNNDYDGMHSLFEEKTGKDLNDIIKKLNKVSRLSYFLSIPGQFISKKIMQKSFKKYPTKEPQTNQRESFAKQIKVPEEYLENSTPTNSEHFIDPFKDIDER